MIQCRHLRMLLIGDIAAIQRKIPTRVRFCILTIAVGQFGGGNHPIDIEITLRRRPWANTHDPIGEHCGHAVAVCVGHDGDTLDALVCAGPNDTYGDLATIGDEHAPKCRHDLRPGFDDDQGLAELHHGAVIHQNRHDCARNAGLDVVHELHDLDDADSVLGVYLLADFHE